MRALGTALPSRAAPRVARARASRAKGRQGHEEHFREAYWVYCGVREGELRKEAPEGFQGFLDAEDGQRQNMERLKLSTRMFNSRGQHFVRLRRAFPGQVLDFWQWDEQANPELLVEDTDMKSI